MFFRKYFLGRLVRPFARSSKYGFGYPLPGTRFHSLENLVEHGEKNAVRIGTIQSTYYRVGVSCFFFFSHTSTFPASRQAVVTGVVSSSPRFLPSFFIERRVQHSHCSSIFYQVLLTHALALSASQFVHKKKSQRIHASMHSAGLELTKLTYTRLEDNLIRHGGDRLSMEMRR